MWLPRIVDQLAKVGIHGEEDSLLTMREGQHIRIRHTPVHVTGKGHIVTAGPQAIGDGDPHVHVY